MRIIFGVLSLVLALAVVGFLVKKQLPLISASKLLDGTLPNAGSSASGTSQALSTDTGPATPSPGPGPGPGTPLITSPNVQQQSQLIQQQVQQQLRAATEAALQQTRPEQDQK